MKIVKYKNENKMLINNHNNNELKYCITNTKTTLISCAFIEQ